MLGMSLDLGRCGLAFRFALGLIACACAAACGAAPGVGSTSEEIESVDATPRPDDGFIEQYAATHGFRLGWPAAVRIAPGGDKVLFLRSGGRSFERDLYELDTATGETKVLLTASQLLEGAEETISDVERARRERLRLAARGITRYEMARDGKRLLIPLSGRLFVFDRETRAVIERTPEAGYPDDAHFSPDARRIGCVIAGDLYVIEVDSGHVVRLTESASPHLTNGLPEFVAQEEMGRYRGFWWSPDGETLAYQQTDASAVETLHIVDPVHPEKPAHAARYPRAGTANATVRLGLVPAAGGQTRWIEWDRDASPYLATVKWTKHGPLTLVVEDRRQQAAHVLVVDPDTGQTHALFAETDDAWLNLDQAVPRWLPDDKGFLWSTERDGQWQLELREPSGQRVRAMTPPSLGYTELLGVSGDGETAWVRASEQPDEAHVYRISLGARAAAPVKLSDGAGVHSAVFSSKNDLWILHHRPADGTPVDVVYRDSHGQQIEHDEQIPQPGQKVGELESAAEVPDIGLDVTFETVGEHDFRAVVIRPRDYRPGQRLPVIVWVYGGPGHQSVTRNPRRFRVHQWLANRGFVVVVADGRGTPARGRDWERTIRGDFITVPLQDQITALQALGRKHPEMDLTRVGIYGWSFGGYFSAMAVMQRPDVFHAGVAGAPVADWIDYDTHYTERYMGLPEENAKGYAHSNVLTHAPKLERPLLIVHGTADDNVYFTHAVKMSDALLRAGRDHEFLPLSGFTHMVAEPDVARHLMERVAGFFRRHLR